MEQFDNSRGLTSGAVGPMNMQHTGVGTMIGARATPGAILNGPMNEVSSEISQLQDGARAFMELAAQLESLLAGVLLPEGSEKPIEAVMPPRVTMVGGQLQDLNYKFSATHKYLTSIKNRLAL